MSDTLDRYGPKPAREIDAERYDEALNCLPPCQWRGVGTSFESFHVSERLSGNIVSWYVRCNDRFFQVDQDARISLDSLAHLIGEAIA